MGIRCSKCWMLYRSIDCIAVEPEYLGISERQVREYLREHEMPADPLYSQEDLIGDVTRSSGAYTLPIGVYEETVYFITEMLDALAR